MCTKKDLPKIAEEFTSKALKICPAVDKIIMYGSYARGDNTPESDIDVMVVIGDTEANVKLYRKLFTLASSDLGMKYDVLLSVLIRDKANFERRLQYMPFYKNVVGEGVEWYGRTA